MVLCDFFKSIFKQDHLSFSPKNVVRLLGKLYSIINNFTVCLSNIIKCLSTIVLIVNVCSLLSFIGISLNISNKKYDNKKE